MKLIILIISILFIGACSTKPYIVKSSDIKISSAKMIYVVSHGWHTGFVIPVETIQRQLPQLRQRFKDTAYIEFGWGDKGFYQAKEITSGLTIQAIFWPTESVIHAVAVHGSVRRYFHNSKVEALCLQSEQYSKLIKFIEDSFYLDTNNKIIALKKGIYGNSQFYKGVGKYYLMNTCNKWTAKGLSSAKIGIPATFKLTAGSIMAYLLKHKKRLTKCSR